MKIIDSSLAARHLSLVVADGHTSVFERKRFSALLNDYKNLVIMRTLSKG